ncbi:MAG: HAMP domain-containing sensor histidine kinase [Patescibacteria group bacterium]
MEHTLDYAAHVKERFENLRLLFARAAVGDFSSTLDIPEGEEHEEIIELYTGINIMLDVIKRQLAREEEISRAKSEFVALVSHQLRTPLTAIRWSVELLQKKAQHMDADEVKSVHTISEETDHMTALVNTFLDVSRIDLGVLRIELEPLDVVAAAKTAVAEIAPDAEAKGLTVEEHYMANSLTIAADPGLMHVVFQNLLSNAVKYTPRGGTVRVAIAQEGAGLQIVVSDTGLGIPESQREQIFTKLFRADNANKSETDGSGLGLYIVKAIITEAGGDIRFETEEGKGTSFFITLPKEGMHQRGGNVRLH